MLPFGSITSVVPLVVLGLAYMVYLGAVLLNKPATDEFPGQGETNNIIEADLHESHGSFIPDYRYLVDNIVDEYIESDTKPLSWEQILSVIHELPAARPSVLHSVSQFLPRPPPSC